MAAVLAGQVAVVTGGGRGIGRAAAVRLGELGAEVVVVARTGGELDQTVADVRATGATASAIVADVTDEDAVRSVFDTVDRVDILVNSAGANRPGPFVDTTGEAYDSVMDLNVRALFTTTRYAARTMIARGTPGLVVNVSSQMGHVGAALRTLYCMSKHAVEGFTKAVAIELAPHGIRVNCVAPTFVETELTRPFFADEAFRTWVLDRIPLRRLATVDDVAEAIAYLAHPRAALVTGTSLVLDGGWTAQ